MNRRRLRIIGPLLGPVLASALLLTNCGDDRDGSPAATAAQPSSSPPATTPASTTASIATTGVGGSTDDRASGSGCTPGGEALPDGRWFGFVDDATADQVSFDLACWFSGTAAVAAAAEDGEESPPPNDFHIRNDNDRLRSLAVDGDTMVSWLPDPGDPQTEETIAYENWWIEQSGRAVRPGVWLDVERGAVVAIEEQYVP